MEGEGKGGGRRGEGRRSIAWTMTKRVEDTEATQLSGVARWRETIESTQLRRFARWRGKKYSYWLSCTHVTLKIPTILP
jgi:hypothetical protein